MVRRSRWRDIDLRESVLDGFACRAEHLLGAGVADLAQRVGSGGLGGQSGAHTVRAATVIWAVTGSGWEMSVRCEPPSTWTIFAFARCAMVV
jgi:hypothetical protein